MRKTYTLRNVQVFDVGTHNGIPFSQMDVDKMTEHSNVAHGHTQPFFAIGHDRKDGGTNIGAELADDRSDLPALGWLQKFRKVGTKIVTDIKQVPAAVVECVQKGAYKRLSPDVEFNYRDPVTGERYPFVIKALRILGARTPAIKTISSVADVLALGEDSQTHSMDSGADIDLESFVAEEEGDDSMAEFKYMTVEQAENALAELVEGMSPDVRKAMNVDGLFEEEKEPKKEEETPTPKGEEKDQVTQLLEQVQKQSETIKGLEEKNKKLSGAVDEVATARRREKIGAKVDELVNAGRVEPKMKEAVMAYAEKLPAGQILEFEDSDGKKHKVDPAERFLELLGTQSKRLEFEELGHGAGGNIVEFEEQYDSGRETFEALGVTKEDWVKYGPHAEEFAEMQSKGELSGKIDALISALQQLK